MRTGPRLLVAALVAGALAVSGPAASGQGPARRSPTSSEGAEGSGPVTDVARIEPLPAPAGAPAPTVALDGVGEYRGLARGPPGRRGGRGGQRGRPRRLPEGHLRGAVELAARGAAGPGHRRPDLPAVGAGQRHRPAPPPPSGPRSAPPRAARSTAGWPRSGRPTAPAWAAAVRDTAGLALLSGGAPILAKYSACNGGRSVSGGKPYLKVVDDPDDARCPLHRWGLSVSYDDLGRALAVPGTVKAVRATAGDVVVDWTGDGGRAAARHSPCPGREFRAKVGAAVPPPADRQPDRAVDHVHPAARRRRPGRHPRRPGLRPRHRDEPVGCLRQGPAGHEGRGDPGRLLRRHPADQGAAGQAPGPGAGGRRRREAGADARRRRSRRRPPPGSRAATPRAGSRLREAGTGAGPRRRPARPRPSSRPPGRSGSSTRRARSSSRSPPARGRSSPPPRACGSCRPGTRPALPA